MFLDLCLMKIASHFIRSAKTLANTAPNCWSSKKSTQKFLNFVTTTYQELVKREEAISKDTSSLRIFCRLDVAVLEDTGQLCYFVRGVERSFGTILYASSSPSAPTCAVSLVDALGALVLSMQK